MRPLAQFLRGWGASNPVQVAAPTLTLVDNADGTGATATIAGATAGTTNTVYGVDWKRRFASGAYASLGSRSGNGTLQLAVADGYHAAYVFSTDGVTSQVSRLEDYRTTSGEAAVFQQILDALQATAQAMVFDTIDPDNIYIRKFPLDRDVEKPAILFWPLQEQQPTSGENAGTNAREGIGYGIGFLAMQRSNREISTDTAAEQLARLLMWRQQVNRMFRVGRLTGIAEVAGKMAIEPGPPIVPADFDKQYDTTSFTIRIWTREVGGAF